MTDALTMWSSTDSLSSMCLSIFESLSLWVRGVAQLHKNQHTDFWDLFVCVRKGARERYHDDGIRNQPYIKSCVYLCLPLVLCQKILVSEFVFFLTVAKGKNWRNFDLLHRKVKCSDGV